MCARLPNSSFARRASYGELAVVNPMYSLKTGNVFQSAYALKARIISTPVRDETSLMSLRFRRRRCSSNI